MTDRGAVLETSAVSVAPNGWCSSRSKRGLDIAIGALAIVLTLPLMVLICVAIKISSDGPVFFRQRRVGKAGVSFTFVKFRTMYYNRCEPGSGLTRQGDRRITPIGRVLRKTKLDELPQFFHVLRGSMSLVGPRPDLPKYLAHLRQDCEAVLNLTPGITGHASLKFHNEEAVLAEIPASQLEDYYVRCLLPEKAQLDISYAQTASLWTDLSILIRTVLTVFRSS